MYFSHFNVVLFTKYPPNKMDIKKKDNAKRFAEETLENVTESIKHIPPQATLNKIKVKMNQIYASTSGLKFIMKYIIVPMKNGGITRRGIISKNIFEKKYGHELYKPLDFS